MAGGEGVGETGAGGTACRGCPSQECLPPPPLLQRHQLHLVKSSNRGEDTRGEVWGAGGRVKGDRGQGQGLGGGRNRMPSRKGLPPFPLQQGDHLHPVYSRKKRVAVEVKVGAVGKKTWGEGAGETGVEDTMHGLPLSATSASTTSVAGVLFAS